MSQLQENSKTGRGKTPAAASALSGGLRPIVICYVFQSDKHLGWDCFHKQHITIGCADQADLVLPADGIAAVQAHVILNPDNQILVKTDDPGQSILVNNQPVDAAILGRFDYLDIGPYTIKIKLSAQATLDRLPEERRLPEKQPLEQNQPDVERHSALDNADRSIIRPADPIPVSDPEPEASQAEEPVPLKDSPRKKVQFYPRRRKAEKREAHSEKRHRLPDPDPQEESPAARESNACRQEPAEESTRYQVVFLGTVDGRYSRKEVARRLKKLLQAGETAIQWLSAREKVVVKSGLTNTKALKLKQLLEKAGANAGMEVLPEQAEGVSEQETEKQEYPEAEPSTNVPWELLPSPMDEEEADEEDPDLEAVFTLQEMLLASPAIEKTDQGSETLQLEVTKFCNSRIVDIFFLKTGQRYHIRSQEEKFLLAENSSAGQCSFYFSDYVYGTLQKGDTAVVTDHLKTVETRINKRGRVHRYSMEAGDAVTLTDGVYEYIIRAVYEAESPEVPLPEAVEKNFHKYLIKSSVVHLFFLVFIGLFHSVHRPQPIPPETHFVQIDPATISKMIRKKRPPKPVIPKKVKPAAPQKQVARKVVSRKSKRKLRKGKTGRKAIASRSPKAGGGFGKGNVTNRNINQAGLLSMLGDTVGIKPQEAMAAVTNLDAVSAAPASKPSFTVGGIVGKLGSPKIEIPKAGVVRTKGSTQVLRSAGARGVGTVAALEKGKTGQKQVQGMVSARLNKTVRVQGGMSRQAVKRVIDQHLDEISYCYETALIANPSIIGKVVFEWKILMSGKVGMVRIQSSTINSSEIHACIKAAIKTWRFPQPKGSEVIVSYPFVFDIVGF